MENNFTAVTVWESSMSSRLEKPARNMISLFGKCFRIDSRVGSRTTPSPNAESFSTRIFGGDTRWEDAPWLGYGFERFLSLAARVSVRTIKFSVLRHTRCTSLKSFKLVAMRAISMMPTYLSASFVNLFFRERFESAINSDVVQDLIRSGQSAYQTPWVRETSKLPAGSEPEKPVCFPAVDCIQSILLGR
jgi:hypothetical protein